MGLMYGCQAMDYGQTKYQTCQKQSEALLLRAGVNEKKCMPKYDPIPVCYLYGL